MAAFFWLMSLCVPCGIVVIPELERFKFLKQYIPSGLTTIEISIIVFIIFLVFGCVAGAFGMEPKKKTTTETPQKIDERYDEILY